MQPEFSLLTIGGRPERDGSRILPARATLYLQLQPGGENDHWRSGLVGVAPDMAIVRR
jgi:hypothetical protein